MRSPAGCVSVLVVLLTIGGNAANSQTPPSSGTLQVPSHPRHDQPVTPPKAAPRQPIHKAGAPTKGRTPVVPPHGPTHPRKPVAAAAAGSQQAMPVPPMPPAAALVNSPAETKTGQPEKPHEAETTEAAAEKLPRFAALRSDDVNMRAGPGTRYRIDWVYKRRDLPVEIEREFEVWRWVRDADGVQGWVHQATLMNRRSFIVQKADATLRSDPSDTASAVAILRPGVIGRIRSCEAASDWCSVQTGSYRGYLRREEFWGTLPNEAINP
jgi:SH3-like domain-containing protein